MKDTLAAGLHATRSVTIDRPRTIDFLGEQLRVYATPELVRDFEIACRDLLLAHLDPGEDSVGTQVHITHGGATLLGMQVSVEVRIAAIDGRRVDFELVARDALEEIGRGTHQRFVVEVAKLRARVAAKAAKLATSAG